MREVELPHVVEKFQGQTQSIISKSNYRIYIVYQNLKRLGLTFAKRTIVCMSTFLVWLAISPWRRLHCRQRSTWTLHICSQISMRMGPYGIYIYTVLRGSTTKLASLHRFATCGSEVPSNSKYQIGSIDRGR